MFPLFSLPSLKNFAHFMHLDIYNVYCFFLLRLICVVFLSFIISYVHLYICKVKMYALHVHVVYGVFIQYQIVPKEKTLYSGFSMLVSVLYFTN